MKDRVLWHAVFAGAGGLLLGSSFVFALPSLEVRWGWIVSIAFLAGLAGTVTVSFEPHGSLSLSPLVFTVAAVFFGLPIGILTAGLAPLVTWASTLGRSPMTRSIDEVLSLGGEYAVAIATSGVLLESIRVSSLPWVHANALSVPTIILVLLFQMGRISGTEGIRFRRLIAPILRSSSPHLVFMAIGASLVLAAKTVIGPFGILLGTVVIIELYYPWKLLGEQRELFLKSLQMMSNAVDLKDPYTAHHSRRVAEYAVRMARHLDIPEHEVQRIHIGALMHDIGKVGVPGGIIRKPSKLTADEMEIMKRHVEAGADLVQGLEVLDKSADIVRHHHENLNGTGYPAGLKGSEIPLGARIVFVADAFDALTTDRPYRKGRSAEEALQVLEANSQAQFDPVAVDALRHILRLSSQ